MLRWTTTMTNIGEQNIANAIANGKTIKITRVKASRDISELSEETLKNKTDVDDYVKDFNIVSARQIDNSVNLIIQLNSENVTTKFNLKQIGIFAKIDEEQEFLWFLQQCSDSGDVVEADSENINKSVLEYSYTINITSDAKVISQLNQSSFISLENFNNTISYLENLIDKNTVEATQNYIKFKNNIALLYGIGSHNSAADNLENGGKGKKIAFTNELSIKKVLCVQIESIAMDGIADESFNPDLINERLIVSTYDESGFYFYHNIINAKRFFWFAVVVIE